MKEHIVKAKSYIEKNGSILVALGCVSVPVMLFMIGGYIIVTATVYAIISTIALGILLYKASISENSVVRRLYRFSINKPLATDALFTYFVYMISPGGIIGILGASIAAVLGSGLLMILKGFHNEETDRSSEKCTCQAS